MDLPSSASPATIFSAAGPNGPPGGAGGLLAPSLFVTFLAGAVVLSSGSLSVADEDVIALNGHPPPTDLLPAARIFLLTPNLVRTRRGGMLKVDV